MELNDLLAPLLAKGQSINHIFATHADEIGLSEKTIYNYFKVLFLLPLYHLAFSFSFKDQDLVRVQREAEASV